MKKETKISAFLALFIFIAFLSCASSTCYANDTRAPEITAVRVLNKEVTRPGILKVEIDVKAYDFGITEAHVYLQHPVESEIPQDSFSESGGAWEGKSVYSGTIKVNCGMSSEKALGEWVVQCVSVTDSYGNTTTISRGMIWDDSGNHMSDTLSSSIKAPTFTVKDEFDFDSKMALSNPNLANRLRNMDEGKALGVVIDNDSNSILPKAAFDAIAGSDKTIVAYKNGYQWIIYGKDIRNTTKDIDLSISLNTISEETYDTSEDAIAVNFANNGTLPAPVEIRLKSDYLYSISGIKGVLYLYYINNGVPELQNNPNFDLVFDGTDKWCYFTIDHNSQYLVTGSKVNSKSHVKKGSEVNSKSHVKKGSEVTINTNKYKVISTKSNTVAFTKAKNKNSVTVPATVKINGKTYKVTQINANAFKGSKIKTITIGKNVRVIKKNAFKGSKATKLILKTKLLKKSKVKGCLKGSKINTVQVKVSSKKSVNKKYVKKYKTYFTKTNAGKKVTVK